MTCLKLLMRYDIIQFEVSTEECETDLKQPLKILFSIIKSVV